LNQFNEGDNVIYTKGTSGDKYRARFIGKVITPHAKKTLVEFSVDGKIIRRLLANKNLRVHTDSPENYTTKRGG